MFRSSFRLAFATSLIFLAATAAAQSATNRNAAAPVQSQPNYDWIHQRGCGIHLTIRDVDCRDFDVEAAAKEFERMHVDFLSFFAAGYVTTYPTSLEFERVSPWLGGRDLAGDLIRAAHRHGLKVVPAIDLGMLPEAAFKAHPEWAVVDADGKPVLRTDGLYASCILAGYVQEYSRAMIAELLERYDVDGMKFGGASYGFLSTPCHCAACRKAYADATGKEIPVTRSRDNSRLAGLLGIRFQGDAKPVIGELHGVVQAYAKKSLDHPVLADLRDVGLVPLSGWFCPVAVQAPAKPILVRTAPFQTFPEGWSYPKKTDPNDPILIVNENPDAGRTAYFAPQIGRAFWQSRFPDLATLIADTIQWTAHAEPPLRVEGPPTLHTSLRRSGNRFMVHCINLTGGERLFSELIPLHDLRISLRCDDGLKVRRAWRASDGAKLRTEKHGAYVTARLDRLTDYDVVVFEMGK